MADIFNFEGKKENENQQHDEHIEECEFCNLIDETFDFIFNMAENRNEIIEYLINAFHEAKSIGHQNGIKEIISYGLYSLEECDCDGCTDGDCDC